MREHLPAEQAQAEFDRWAFDIKRISRLKMEKKEYQDNKEVFIENLIEGIFSIDEEGNIIHKLAFPLGERTELKYKPRLVGREFTSMSKAKDGDHVGKALSIISELAGVNRGLLMQQMDSIDVANAQAVAGFYMVG